MSLVKAVAFVCFRRRHGDAEGMLLASRAAVRRACGAQLTIQCIRAFMRVVSVAHGFGTRQQPHIRSIVAQ